jgi:signal transduction histidine kinase
MTRAQEPPGSSGGRATDGPATEHGGDTSGLSFPDLPRLELDQLLGQLVERAREVMATRDRLGGLLRANQAVTSDLALPVVLRRIVEAARELIGARYAALGVIAPDGHLAEFIHVGMPADVVEGIGHLPQGKGLLGALIDDPRPIRLRRIAEDQRSSGFPPGHPPMSSFLGVPIRVRNEVFGNLYLAESARGEFSAEDEQLVTALAATAGVAVENARLYAAARTRGEWLQASIEIGRRLLSGDGGDPGRPLRLIAERSREIAHADLVSVVLPDDGDGLRVAVVVGPGADEWAGMRVPRDGSLSGRVFSTREPLRLTRGDEHPGITFLASDERDIGPVLVVPLLGTNRVHGVLSVARLVGRPAFTDEDLDMAGGFANQAALALELAEARAEQQRAAMLDERDRIAADLHDHIIQRLFAAGLTLQSVASTLPRGRAADRVLGTVEDLDDTISQIRTTIFRLHQVPGRGDPSVRGRLLDVVADVAPALGFNPALRFNGPLDTILPDDVGEDVAAVVREALTNVVRHAAARSAEVEVTVDDGWLSLVVRDDGVGMAPSARRSGLANMQRRAEQHGGRVTVTATEPSGTRLSWTVPIP